MLLGFKRQFAPLVEEGSKRHSIRGERKIAPRVGETCHCYVDPRQKTMRLLGRWPCSKVEGIEIYERGDGSFGVVIEGVELSIDEKNDLAWRDGFRNCPRGRSFEAMMRFWMLTHGNAKRKAPFVFRGHVIHWDTRPADTPAGQTAARARRKKAR